MRGGPIRKKDHLLRGGTCVRRTASPMDITLQATAALLAAAQSPATRNASIGCSSCSGRWTFNTGCPAAVGHLSAIAVPSGRSSLSNTHRTTRLSAGTRPLLLLPAAAPPPVATPHTAAAVHPTDPALADLFLLSVSNRRTSNPATVIFVVTAPPAAAVRSLAAALQVQ